MILMFLLASLDPAQAGTDAYRSAYDQAFRTSFRAKSIAQCSVTAQAAAGKVDVAVMCGCMTDHMFATRSVEELGKEPDPAELRVLAGTCVREQLSGASRKP